MDFEQFEKQISVDTHTFILCNPQNPTGNCWSPEDLLRIGEICLKHRVVVLADEIHCDCVAKGQKYTPFASLANKDVVDNSITFKAASKSFGLAAHKTAWFYSTNADYMKRIKVHHRADLNTLGIVANMGAYTPEGEEWLSQVVDYVDGNTRASSTDFINAKMPMREDRQAAGHLPAVARLHRRRREDQHRRRLAADYNRTKAADAPALTPEQMVERYLVKTAKVHLNAGHSYGKGWREPHAHEHRHVAQDDRAGAQQPRRRAQQDVEHVTPRTRSRGRHVPSPPDVAPCRSVPAPAPAPSAPLVLPAFSPAISGSGDIRRFTCARTSGARRRPGSREGRSH